MTTGKIALIGTAALIGIVIPTAIVLIHNQTKEIKWDQEYIQKNALKDDSSDWNKLASKLNDQHKFHDAELNNLKKSTSDKSEELRKWCNKAYASTYKSSIISANNQLLKDVKIACILHQNL